MNKRRRKKRKKIMNERMAKMVRDLGVALIDTIPRAIARFCEELPIAINRLGDQVRRLFESMPPEELERLRREFGLQTVEEPTQQSARGELQEWGSQASAESSPASKTS